MDLPNEDELRWIVTHYASFVAEHGEAIGEPELIKPNGEYFPDEFSHDAESIARLFRRMLSYAPVSDNLDIALRFFEPEEAGGGGGGCSSGACSTGGAGSGVREGLVETDEGYVVEVNVADVRSPVMLTTSLARSLGALVLAEAGEVVDPRTLGAASEIAAVATGFGILLHQGSYVYGKSCGGARVHQATKLSVTELGVALALFVCHHGIKPSACRSQLDTTQREAFDVAIEWAESSEAIISGLRDRPNDLAEGRFEVSPPKAGLLGRLFGRSSPRKAQSGATTEDAVTDELVQAAQAAKQRASRRTPEQQRRLDESRALAEEALGRTS